MRSASISSRRKLGNIQISPRRVRVVALADGATSARTYMISHVMTNSGLSGARSWGSKIAEVGGSSWIGMGASGSMTGMGQIFAAMVKTLVNVRGINKCSRIQRFLAR
jgi:hypothetical protein